MYNSRLRLNQFPFRARPDETIPFSKFQCYVNILEFCQGLSLLELVVLARSTEAVCNPDRR